MAFGGHRRAQRSDKLVIAWSQNPGRPRALAETVGAAAFAIYPQVGGLRHPVIRYAVSSVMTAIEIARRRPRVVIVQNPVVFPALIAWCWVVSTGGLLILDSHPSAFGAKDNRQGRVMLPVSRWLSRRARATLVTVPEYVDLLESWGARGLVVHEPPVEVDSVKPVDLVVGRRTAFVATLFAEDEPLEVIAEVARSMPDVTFVLTGREERCRVPAADRPTNWLLPGFLSLPEFLRHMASSDVVLSLTDDVTSVARSGYEATYLEVPLVVSDVPSMIDAFPRALACGSSADDIATAVRRILNDPPDAAVLQIAHAEQLARWEHQRAGLLDVCNTSAPSLASP